MAEAIVEIGPYRIERELGRGGMGVVYLGVDARLDREVAIKLLPADIAQDSVSRERFTNEARSAARLQHPNILPIYDVGEYEGRPFLVMQCVHGGDLATWLEPDRRLSVVEAGHLLHAIAAGIDAAHAYGVIHRDIKPENVLLGDNGQAMLTDFGIARITDGRSRGLTQTGMIMGTPEYMSPEQAMGNPVDHRSDLYSFGAIAYRVLTGQPPFSGDTAVTVALKHVQEALPDPRGLVPELSPGTANALGRMMAKSPDERYDTAKAFVDALLAGTETYQPGQVPAAAPVAAVMPPPGQEVGAAQVAEAPRASSGVLVPVLLAAVLLLAGGLVLVSLFINDTKERGGQRESSQVATAAQPVIQDGPPPNDGFPTSQMATVPPVVGLSWEEGVGALADNGLSYRTVEQASSSPEGQILEQYPQPGYAPPDSEVVLTVSSGPAEEYVPPPPAPAPALTRTDKAKGVLRDFHRYLSNHEFRSAWNLYSPAYQRTDRFDRWSAGYHNTVRSEVSELQVIEDTPSLIRLRCKISWVNRDGSGGSVRHQYRMRLIDGWWKIDGVKGVD